MSLSSVIVVIPAYNPTHELLHVIEGLSRNAPGIRILVVDDGSSSRSQPILAEAQRHPSVRVITHAVREGKGQALKTAIRALSEHHPDCTHIVTADADGQHAVDDVLAVAKSTQQATDCLILGSRRFNVSIPLRSRIGNTGIQRFFAFSTGMKLADTQTGLRGMSIDLGVKFLAIPQRGYDFEMAMLIQCKEHGIPVKEVPIKTIYHRGNPHSHFNPVVDSLKICLVIVRYLFRLVLIHDQNDWRISRTDRGM